MEDATSCMNLPESARFLQKNHLLSSWGKEINKHILSFKNELTQATSAINWNTQSSIQQFLKQNTVLRMLKFLIFVTGIYIIFLVLT